jgi:hypothetical protein
MPKLTFYFANLCAFDKAPCSTAIKSESKRILFQA